MARKARAATAGTQTPKGTRQKRVRQTDVPSVSLEKALRVPNAIAESYAKQPTPPEDVAAALDVSPTSSSFRQICGAAIGYGITDGGWNAALISLTPVGMRVVSPTVEDDDKAAMRKAVLTPTVQKRFLEQYDGSSLPPEKIAKNVLEKFGVPGDRAAKVYAIIQENAEQVGFIETKDGKDYVNLHGAPALNLDDTTGEADPDEQVAVSSDDSAIAETESPAQVPITPQAPPNRHVFISHGKEAGIVEQLKDFLEFGGFEPIVAVEEESSSTPVPKKVMDSMRKCSAGIIHVSAEEHLLDSDGNQRHAVNQNVLIEIGAAMALYDDRFILLVEEGTTLPSNLQGLYEVRYTGTTLDSAATMKVLKAASTFKVSD